MTNLPLRVEQVTICVVSKLMSGGEGAFSMILSLVDLLGSHCETENGAIIFIEVMITRATSLPITDNNREFQYFSREI